LTSIKCVAQGVTQKIDAENGNNDGNSRERNFSPRLKHMFIAVAEQRSPIRSGELSSQTEEAEGRRGKDRRAKTQGTENDQRVDDIWKYMMNENMGIAGTLRLTRLDVVKFAGLQG